MGESLRTRLVRHVFNCFPAYRGTGARVTHIERDWREVRIRLPLSWRTKNYVGTIFGGSMYGAVDPIYMVMLIRILGEEFTVWDREATVEFREPGEETLYARFRLPEAELDRLRALDPGESVDREYDVDLVSADGTVHAHVEKTLYVRRDE